VALNVLCLFDGFFEAIRLGAAPPFRTGAAFLKAAGQALSRRLAEIMAMGRDSEHSPHEPVLSEAEAAIREHSWAELSEPLRS